MNLEPRRNKYVGHRYVPKIMGEWTKENTYEGLSIVTFEGGSYTSKKRVPVGIDIKNEEYWVLTGNYNAQIESYRNEVKSYKDNVDVMKEEQDTMNSIFDEKLKRGIVTLEDHGGIGDGITDDTQAFQKAVDECEITGKTLVILPKTYKITETIFLPSSIRMTGYSNDLNAYSSNKKVSQIEIHSKNGFMYKKTKRITAQISNIFFKSVVQTIIPGSTDGTEDSYLFKDIEFNSSNITGNVFFNFGTVFFADITGVSRIYNNSFTGIRRYVFDGMRSDGSAKGGSIIDSYIFNNYINGFPNTNCVAFRLRSITTTSISDNYMDFFKTVFNISSTESVTIDNNIVEYCYKVFKSDSNIIQKCNINNNQFRKISKTMALAYFKNADSDMLNGKWVILEHNTMYMINFTNNMILDCDLTMILKGFSNRYISLKNNIYNKDKSKMIELSLQKDSNTSDDMKEIYIEELDNIYVNVLPNPSLLGVDVKTFINQKIVYNNKLLFNRNGQWFDTLGNHVTE